MLEQRKAVIDVTGFRMDEHKSTVMEHNARDHIRCRIRIFQRNDAGYIRIARCAHLPSSPLVESAYKVSFSEIKVSAGNNSCQRTMVQLLFIRACKPASANSNKSANALASHRVQLLHLMRNRACLSIFTGR